MTSSNKVKTDKSKLEKVHKYLTECVAKMKLKQDKLMNKYNFGKENNKFVLYPERNAFYLFNQDTKNVFFQAKFQIIGTYSEKSRTWRWGWSNRYVPYDLKQTALKIKKFGEANKVEILFKPKIKDENLGHIFTALGMELSKSNGYYIVPATKTYPSIYLIFTNFKKVNLDYTDVVKQMNAESRANHQFMRNKLKTPKISKKKVTLKTKKNKPTVKPEKKPKTPVKKPEKPVKKPEKKPEKPVKKPSQTKKKPQLKMKKVSETKSKSTSSTSNSKKRKIKLSRSTKENILMPLKKVAKLRTNQIDNNDYENNQNNNEYLVNNKKSKSSLPKIISNVDNNTSNVKSHSTSNSENRAVIKNKIVIPIKKKLIKKNKN